jgi:serine/threonine-protein kinase
MPVETATGGMLGHFRLREKIGSGGMGEVYRAHDEHLDRDVAIKVLPSQPAGTKIDVRARNALRQEALTLSRLNHPNIAQVYDFDSDGDSDFIVMEFVPGESLALRLDRGPVSQPETLSIAEQTLSALAAAHAQGIVHRDLKPANLQITPPGQVKVLDFGLAQLVRTTDFELNSATTATQETGISGTLAYMSPEQLLGQPADARSDIWSFGVVLYEIMTGQLPFRGKTVAETADFILHGEVPAVTEPTPLFGIIRNCLAKDVAQRYQSAKAILDDLTLAASGRRPASSVQSGNAWLKRYKGKLFAVAGLVVILALVAGRYLWQQSSRNPRPDITSVAVLPLANLSGDSSQDYFADGMTDAIINELSRASSLKVISRTSSMRYKGTNKSVAEIARELGVDAVIEGSVMRAGDRVRINAQLTYAPTDKQIWADSFERDQRNVLSLQAEIAHAIMRQLRVRLEQGQNQVALGMVDPEAYDALLKARFYTYRITAEDNAKAEQFAREAIGRQPDLGEAYHILSEILWYQGMTLGTPTVEESRNRLQESLAAADKAIALGANAHSTRGLLLFDMTGDLAAAEQEYRRSIELQPNFSNVHGHYGVFLALIGRCPEARTELLRAVELDPTGEFAISVAGEFLMYCHDLPSSERFLLAAMDLDPSYQRAHRLAETVCLLQGRIPKFLELVDSSTRSEIEKADIHRVFAKGGEPAYRQWALQRVLRDPPQNQRAMNLASAYAFAGDPKQTLAFLRKALEQGDPRLRMIRAFPQYRFLYGDPEYNAILKEIGLPETGKLN